MCIPNIACVVVFLCAKCGSLTPETPKFMPIPSSLSPCRGGMGGEHPKLQVHFLSPDLSPSPPEVTGAPGTHLQKSNIRSVSDVLCFFLLH